MYLWIVFGILAIIVSLFIAIMVRQERDMLGLLFIFPISLVIFLAVFFVGMVIPNGKVETSETTQLVSLRDSQNISGSFYLFGGSIGERPCYYFYKTNADGSYSLDKADATIVKVFEENRTDGEMVAVYLETVPTNHWSWNNGGKAISRYEFHIPIGSISRQFILNAGNR